MIKKFTDIDGASGDEKKVQDAVLSEIKNYISSYETDNMGNLIVYKKAKDNIKNAPTVILSSHMDEVGLIVTDITTDGMLKFDTVGGISTSVLLSKRVRCDLIFGVIGITPPHFLKKDKKSELPTLDDLFIDIGATSKEDAEKYVQKGDLFCFDSSYTELEGGIIKAKTLDDRLGCIAIIELLKEEYPVNIIALFNVQEETGLRGAKVSAFEKDADFAIVIEATTAQDVGDAEKHKSVTKLNLGAVLSVIDSSTIYDNDLLNTFISLAKENDIKYQIKCAATGGNDAGEIHMANGGIKTITVSVPARYIHSSSSVIAKKDFSQVKNLVSVFLKNPFLIKEKNND